MIRVLGKLVLLFLLVYAGVSIWYGRLEDKLRLESEQRETVAAATPEKKTEILRKPDDYTIIVKRNIFQAVVEKKEVTETKPPEPEKLEPTKLRLSLMGTVDGSEQDARAIISDDTKREQDIYQVGDSIQGGIIKTISRGKVILNVNGKDEVLTLKDREGGGPAYVPSPTDYYQEPPAQQAVEERLTPPTTRPRPVVRPRPVRRPSNLRPPTRTNQIRRSPVPGGATSNSTEENGAEENAQSGY